MGFKKISPLEATKKIKEGPLTLIDIRDEKTYQQSHIPNAQHVTPDGLKDYAAKADKTTPVLVYCYRGFSSQQAALFLVKQGFTEVYSLEGGFEGWNARASNA